jgi:hypothetical protein
MRTNLEHLRELEVIVAELEKDVANLELAVAVLIGVQLGEALEIDASLSVRQRIKFITATIKDIT